jgi:hypothetical protein
VPEKNRDNVTSLDRMERKWRSSYLFKEGEVYHSTLDCGHGDWFYGNKGAHSYHDYMEFIEGMHVA